MKLTIKQIYSIGKDNSNSIYNDIISNTGELFDLFRVHSLIYRLGMESLAEALLDENDVKLCKKLLAEIKQLHFNLELDIQNQLDNLNIKKE